MKERCIYCGSKMEYKMKIRKSGFGLILDRVDFCPKCKLPILSETKIPQDIVSEVVYHFEDAFDWVKENALFLFLIIMTSICGYIIIKEYIPIISNQKLEVYLSTVIEVNFALLGLILVAITLAWNRAQEAINELSKIRNSALKILCGDDTSFGNTILEKAIDEYFKNCTDPQRVLPNLHPEKTFKIFGALLATVAYYKPPACFGREAYDKIAVFLKQERFLPIPLHRDYNFFCSLSELIQRLQSHINPNIKKICDEILNLKRENQIDNKLKVVFFFYSLTGNLFRSIILLIILNTVVSIVVLLSTQILLIVINVVTIVFLLILILLYKLITNVIDTTS